MAPVWTPGIDISRYQGRVGRATWADLYAHGERVAMVGSEHGWLQNEWAEANLLYAEAAGHVPATYAALAPRRRGADTIASAKAACGSVWPRLNFVAIDCEVTGISLEQIADAEAAIRAEGLRPALYTARWWWVGHFGDPHDFRHLPLLSAWYDGDKDIDFHTAPYGGWTVADLICEQWAGTVPYCGIMVDRDSFRTSFIYEEDTVTEPDEETREDRARAESICNRAGSYAGKGLQPPPTTQQQLKYLLWLWEHPGEPTPPA